MSTLEKLNFPSATSADWVNIAAQELSNADPFSSLSKDAGGISVKPYYDAKDVSQLIQRKTLSGFASWLNVPMVSVQDANYANQSALQHLNLGADGVLFDLKATVSAEALLKDIELPHCHVFFICDEMIGVPFLKSFKSFVTKKKWNNANGCIYWRDNFCSSIFSVDNVRIGFEIKPMESCVEQLASALFLVVKQIDLLTDSNVSVEKALHSAALLWPVKNNFFLTVAEMRAMRMLWTLVSEAYGVADSTLFLHAYSPAWSIERFQPYGNLIKQTSSSISAVVGTANAITCVAEKEETSMLTRTARNISLILKDESHLDKTNDPVAGSYFIESISIDLAEKAWKKFQKAL